MALQTYVQLVAVGDGYKEARIRMVLFNTNTRADGLLMQAADIRSNTQLQASRRFAMIRFILLLVQEEVQVCCCHFIPKPIIRLALQKLRSKSL